MSCRAWSPSVMSASLQMLLTRWMISYGYSCSKKKQRKSLIPQALKTSLKSLLTSFAWPMDTPSPFVWDLDKAVRRVHASNISKLDETGKPGLSCGMMAKSLKVTSTKSQICLISWSRPNVWLPPLWHKSDLGRWSQSWRQRGFLNGLQSFLPLMRHVLLSLHSRG